MWVQDLLAGGQYATAWSEQAGNQTRTLVVSIAHSYPERAAAATAAADVARCLDLERGDWVKAHRDWWPYYPRSFVSIPDESLESLYWQTIYRFGCTSRTGALLASYQRAHSIQGLPAMVQTHAGPIGTALGQGDTALEGLKCLQDNLHPNGLWSCAGNPCIESTLGMANIVQDVLLQSWSDPAKNETGPIRIFPAVPSTWNDVEFRDLRAEGAFLVSAKRSGGKTAWVKIKSLAGEPCRVQPGIEGKIQVTGDRRFTLQKLSPGV